MKTVSLQLAKELKVKKRFMKYVSINPNGCWDWTGGKNRQGYGHFHLDGDWRAHRAAWLLFKGPLPELQLDHLCRNRACVNPEHLEPVTNRINVMRGILGEVSRARQLSKTHCPRSHEYTIENTRLYKGSRICKECSKKSARASWMKYKDKYNARRRMV